MARIKTFTFRINEKEQEIISALSLQFQRSRSDTLRLILKEAYKQLEEAQHLKYVEDKNERAGTKH